MTTAYAAVSTLNTGELSIEAIVTKVRLTTPMNDGEKIEDWYSRTWKEAVLIYDKIKPPLPRVQAQQEASKRLLAQQ
jgi:hypothetical protein